jgi:hypothetical protein
MQAQITPDGVQGPDKVEHAVFILLVGSGQRPWSVGELELEVGDRVGVADALAHLHGAGLVHRCGGFVWASRAALAADRMAF